MVAGMRHPASFRDPSGFVFLRDGHILRQVSSPYATKWQAVRSSGFLQEAVSRGWLLPFEELPASQGSDQMAVATLRPEQLPFVSYPYEWSFGQLKDAALLTLDLATLASAHGLSLKDASAYNVQFLRGRPVFVDTLSFEPYVEGAPWIAYQQFCRHFLTPLALASKVDPDMARLSRDHIDGIPLKLASRLLPWATRLDVGLASHIHLHAKGTDQVAGDAPSRRPTMSRDALDVLLAHLRRTVEKLTWSPSGTTWGDYYSDTNYSPEARKAKQSLVMDYLGRVPRGKCFDLGANTGEFSRLACEAGFDTYACDFDPAVVERAYQWAKQTKEQRLTPLLLDLTNPSPSLGWAEEERDGFLDRAHGAVVMGLALVHHLAIGNNVPLPMVADLFRRVGDWAVVEFVPKEDSQVRRLLTSREDVFPDYCWPGFVEAFADRFDLVASSRVGDSARTLALFRGR